MKRKIKGITFSKNRKSLTIHFNKKYNHLGLGTLQIIAYLLRYQHHD